MFLAQLLEEYYELLSVDRLVERTDQLRPRLLRYSSNGRERLLVELPEVDPVV